MPNVFSPRDLVSRPDNMDEIVPHTYETKNMMVELLFQAFLALRTLLSCVKSFYQYFY